MGIAFFSIFGLSCGKSINLCSCFLFCPVGGVWGDTGDIDVKLFVADGDDDIDAILLVWVRGWELLLLEAVKVVIFGFVVDGVGQVVVS